MREAETYKPSYSPVELSPWECHFIQTAVERAMTEVGLQTPVYRRLEDLWHKVRQQPTPHPLYLVKKPNDP